MTVFGTSYCFILYFCAYFQPYASTDKPLAYMYCFAVSKTILYHADLTRNIVPYCSLIFEISFNRVRYYMNHILYHSNKKIVMMAICL